MIENKTIIKQYDRESKDYDSIRFMSPGGRLIDKMQKKIVYDFLESPKNKKILDAATGTGRFAIYLAEYGAKVTACDLSEKMLRIGKSKAAKNKITVKFEKGNVEKLPYPMEDFDFVIAIRILMHLQNPEKGLKEMKRVLKKGGYIIFEIPNKISPWTKLNMIFKIKRKKIKKFHPNYSPKKFTYLEIKNMTEKLGLEITDMRSFFWIPETIYYICPNILIPVIEKIEKISNKILPKRFSEHIFFKVKK
jgi:ubiquinone/menaquinone biosynthesis C-methylase UbiE